MSNHEPRQPRSILWPLRGLLGIIFVGTVTFAVPALGMSQVPSEQIIVEKEVVLSGVTGTANAIAKLPDGGFVTVGSWGTGWAVRTDPDGVIVWTYRDSLPGVGTLGEQSDFNSVIPLVNGNVLICGQKTLSVRKRVGLVTILDPKGHLIEERLLVPNDDAQYFFNAVHRCIPWGDGIALSAGGTNGHGAVGWLMRLDGNGQKQWERISPKVGFDDVVAMANQDLVFTQGLLTGESEVVRLDMTGEVRARRTLMGNLQLLRSLEPTNRVSLIVYSGGLKTSLLALNDRLEDAAPEVSIAPIVISKGCGYVLPDSSLALFGYIQKGGDAFVKSYTGVIGHINQAHRPDSEYIFEPLFSSFTAGDAAPISSRRFVTVRVRQVPHSQKNNDIVMTWVDLVGEARR